MFGGFRAVALKEYIHIRRDPFTLFLVLVIPLIQLVMFGYAINTDVKRVRMIVYDADGHRAARDLIAQLENTEIFHLVGRVGSDRELQRAMISGEARVGVKIPVTYSRDLLAERGAMFLVLIDGSDSTVAMQALNAANAVALVHTLRKVVAGRPVVEARPRMLFNPDLRSANFMVPGLLAIILQIATTFLSAFAIVRERERGTLEQLLVTPIRPLALLLGKLVPYYTIGCAQTVIIVLAMRFIFFVPIHGDVLLLFAIAGVFLFTALAFGLLISTAAQNQMQALQMAYAVILPAFLLSGFMFPRESMPLIMRWVGSLVPATYFLQVVRGIVLRGASLAALWPQVAALAAMSAAILFLSVYRFRRTLV